MTDTSARSRQPAGVTAGGQFATEPKHEAGVSLEAETLMWCGRQDWTTGELELGDLLAMRESMQAVLASGRLTESPDEPVLVRASEAHPGRWEIADGHHRVAQAIREGRRAVQVVFDCTFDDEPYEGDLYDFGQHLRDTV